MVLSLLFFVSCIVVNLKRKAQNQSSKLKIKLKDRTYQYCIKMIDFLDNLPIKELNESNPYI